MLLSVLLATSILAIFNKQILEFETKTQSELWVLLELIIKSTEKINSMVLSDSIILERNDSSKILFRDEIAINSIMLVINSIKCSQCVSQALINFAELDKHINDFNFSVLLVNRDDIVDFNFAPFLGNQKSYIVNMGNELFFPQYDLFYLVKYRSIMMLIPSHNAALPIENLISSKTINY